MKRLVALLIVLGLALPGNAQEPAASDRIDPSKLGVSLNRIRRQLSPPESTEGFNAAGLKLTIRVDVFGQAPPIDFFPKDFSLTTGPVPNSAPTHRQHIEFVTPQEFRSPAVPIYGLAIWAAQKLAERSKKSRCEQEVEQYRAAVMQGIAIAAPRCTQ